MAFRARTVVSTRIQLGLGIRTHVDRSAARRAPFGRLCAFLPDRLVAGDVAHSHSVGLAKAWTGLDP